jgi:hypothetical protein
MIKHIEDLYYQHSCCTQQLHTAGSGPVASQGRVGGGVGVCRSVGAYCVAELWVIV